MLYIWDNDYINYTDKIDDVVNLIKSGKQFIIKEKYIFGDIIENKYEQLASDKSESLIYTDLEHPVIISENSFNMCNVMSKNFFDKHKEIIIKEVQSQLLSKRNNIEIYDYMLTDEFISKLIESNINKITFVDCNLSIENINKLQDSFKDIYLRNKDNIKQISKSKLIGDYNLNDLKNSSKIEINTNTTLTDLDNIKYIGDNTSVIINPENKLKLTNDEYYNFIIKVIESLNKYNKTNLVTLNVVNTSEFNNIVLPKINDYSNINIICKGYENDNNNNFSIKKYIQVEEKLTFLVKDIKESELSPFEKYLKVYDIVKNIKEYNQVNNSSFESKSLPYIIDNEYIVCTGFTNLLHNLLQKVDIGSSVIYYQFDKSYDLGFSLEERSTKFLDHSRILVNIKDDKYNVNGYYMADPTWDNSLNEDLYNFSTMTFNDDIKSRRMPKISDIDYIFNVSSFDEFNKKVNVYLNKKIKEDNSVNKNINAFSSVIDVISNNLIVLDSNLYEVLLPDLIKLSSIKKNYELSENNKIKEYELFLTKIGHIMVEKNNNKISREVLVDAISNIKDINKETYLNEINELDDKIFPYKEDWYTETNQR